MPQQPAASPWPEPPPATPLADQEACEALLPRLQAAVAHPEGDSLVLCDAAWSLLSGWPAASASGARIECLLAVAHCRYLLSRHFDALDAARAAVELARPIGADPLLRKALTFLGVCLMETGNLPDAIATLSHALEVAGRTGDAGALSSVWTNLGLALQRSALYDEAAPCFERAAELGQHASAAFLTARRAAYTNLANCALHLDDIRPGLKAARRSIELNSEPATAQDCLSRAVAESNLARLLLSVGDVGGASRHEALAREYAARFPSARGELIALITGGLVDVHSGAVEAGLGRLKAGLDCARRRVLSEVGDALSACVAGYEVAGQPDVALVFMHEILAANREGRSVQVLMHHQRHLDRLDRQPPQPQTIDATLERRQQRLRGHLGAEREWTRNRILLLEQQSVAAELHDDTTGEHCYRVGRLASILGREIGLEDEVCFLIDLAARMHDIGKLVVPDAIMLKPGRLTAGEREIMESHAAAGAEILARSNVPQMHVAEEIARHHHERWDGGGYPGRLARTAIPIAARVTALADVFDALTHVRPYKPAWPVHEALAEVRRLRGLQFDPDLTDVFLALVPRLQREAGDLDRFLGAEAQRSPFVQARRQIAAALKGADPATTLFELRR